MKEGTLKTSELKKNQFRRMQLKSHTCVVWNAKSHPIAKDGKQ